MGQRAPSPVHDPNAWQPLTYVDGSGQLVTPSFVGAQWQHVLPFGMSSGTTLRSRDRPRQVIIRRKRTFGASAHHCAKPGYSTCHGEVRPA